MPSRRTKVTLGDQSLFMAAPKLWNVLPHDIRDVTTSIFKQKLQTYLFKQTYFQYWCYSLHSNIIYYIYSTELTK